MVRAVMLWERVFILLQVLVTVEALAGGLTFVALLCALGKILRRVKGRYYALVTDEGPEIHASMPGFEARTPGGELVRSGDLAGREYVLLLVSPECAPCHTLLAAVEPVRRGLVEQPSFVVAAECSEAEAREYSRRYRLHALMVADPAGAVRAGLGVLRTPYGFLVDSQGTVRMKGVLSHRDHLEALISGRGRSIGWLPWEPIAAPDAQGAGRLAAPVGDSR